MQAIRTARGRFGAPPRDAYGNQPIPTYYTIPIITVTALGLWFLIFKIATGLIGVF